MGGPFAESFLQLQINWAFIHSASLAYDVDQGAGPGGCGRVLPRPKDSRGKRKAGRQGDTGM